MTPPPQGAPGLFRCAKTGLIADIFRQAGLKNISETEEGSILSAGTNQRYWNFMTEVVAPVVAALSKADKAMKEKIRSEVFELLDQKFADRKLAIDSSALVIYGEK